MAIISTRSGDLKLVHFTLEESNLYELQGEIKVPDQQTVYSPISRTGLKQKPEFRKLQLKVAGNGPVQQENNLVKSCIVAGDDEILFGWEVELSI
jgi:hypothetical protein